jgi:hypothetical protein
MEKIIYLIQPCELIGSNRYKIGCSIKQGINRINSGYKKGTKKILVIKCDDPLSIEKIIKNTFKIKFKLVAGTEIFEGNITDIIEEFIKIIKEYFIKNNKELNNEEIENLINKNIIGKIKIINNKIKKNNNVIIKNFDKNDNDLNNIINKYVVKDNNNQINNINNKLKKNIECIHCNKIFSSYSSRSNHTKKFHNELINNKLSSNQNNGLLKCKYCNNIYKYKQGKWKHEQTCKEKNKENIINNEKIENIEIKKQLNELLIINEKLKKENAEIKQQLNELLINNEKLKKKILK